jgi:hypothetical protein
LLTLADSFYRFSQTEDFYPFWAINKNISEKLREVVSGLVETFQTENRPLSEDYLLKTKIAKKESPQFLLSCVEVAKKIERGPFGEIGLVDWPEIRPRGVRDIAYLVLKKIEKPLHFREIVEVSDEILKDFLANRKILPQTLHNELIRDERFVLVGRGIYALREWGYNPGTVKEVIIRILKACQKPMPKEKILQAVQKERLVKENTILLNLADKNYFLRDDQGNYTIKNA